MKVVNDKNQIWHEVDGPKIRIGLTNSFLGTLEECWHILPAGEGTFKKLSPLMTIETNDCLVSILSPVSGNFLNWNTTAANFPDRLTENDVVLTLTSEKVAKAAPPQEAATPQALSANPFAPNSAQWRAWNNIQRERTQQEQLRQMGIATSLTQPREDVFSTPPLSGGRVFANLSDWAVTPQTTDQQERNARIVANATREVEAARQRREPRPQDDFDALDED